MQGKDVIAGRILGSFAEFHPEMSIKVSTSFGVSMTEEAERLAPLKLHKRVTHGPDKN